ncbi:MAG: MBL fold metallo-hydrolase [Bacillota bacterium]
MEIKWYGTATFCFSHQDSSILCDPFLPMNKLLPSPSVDELSTLGDILITHGHFDHLIDVPKLAAAGEAMIFCSEEAAATLLREGVKENRIVAVKPGDQFEKGVFRITVYRGAHIHFDRLLIMRTLLNRRVFEHRKNIRTLLKESRRYLQGEVLVYLIEADGKRILHMGSLNLAENEDYPISVDLLTLPFQGRSDLDDYALAFVRRLEPRALFMHHFDDSFPPVSSTVDTGKFVENMAGLFPECRVIVPAFGAGYRV